MRRPGRFACGVDTIRREFAERRRFAVAADGSDAEERQLLRVWIDATRCDGALRVFGMTLLERLLRGLLRSDAELSDVMIELPHGARSPWPLPRKLTDTLPLSWSQRDAPLMSRFEQALREAQGEPLVAFAADSVVDARVVKHLLGTRGSFAFIGGEGEERSAALRLEREVSAAGV